MLRRLLPALRPKPRGSAWPTDALIGQLKCSVTPPLGQHVHALTVDAHPATVPPAADNECRIIPNCRGSLGDCISYVGPHGRFQWAGL